MSSTSYVIPYERARYTCIHAYRRKHCIGLHVELSAPPRNPEMETRLLRRHLGTADPRTLQLLGIDFTLVALLRKAALSYLDFAYGQDF